MTIIEQAAAALARTRATTATGAGQASAVDAAHLRRTRTAMAREVSVMLGVRPVDVVATADPLRGYGGMPGVLIIVHDPDPAPDSHDGGDGQHARARVWRFVPEVGNSGSGGGAYLLLGACAVCEGEVPMAAISTLADLGLYMEQTGPRSPDAPDPDAPDPDAPDPDDEDGHRPEVPIEFFDDPGHAPGCRGA